MCHAYLYVVDRDFGFAPNPFHGTCTLATCKPRIRRKAKVGDWVVGLGGARLKATGRCIFAMKIDRKTDFNSYWLAPEFNDKKPVRNGSLRMIVGDNIYHQSASGWQQADSHHSNADGSVNIINLQTDTSADSVLIGSSFYYFGRAAPPVPAHILAAMKYKNGRNHRVYDAALFQPFVTWLEQFPKSVVLGDPFDFALATRRYTGVASRVIA